MQRACSVPIIACTAHGRRTASGCGRRRACLAAAASAARVPASSHPVPAPTRRAVLAPPVSDRRLQFWLQFMMVREMPDEFTCPGQNPPELPRTAEQRTFNPWVLGSSPRRPTRSELAFHRSRSICRASGMGRGWPGYGRCLASVTRWQGTTTAQLGKSPGKTIEPLCHRAGRRRRRPGDADGRSAGPGGQG